MGGNPHLFASRSGSGLRRYPSWAEIVAQNSRQKATTRHKKIGLKLHLPWSQYSDAAAFSIPPEYAVQNLSGSTRYSIASKTQNYLGVVFWVENLLRTMLGVSCCSCC